MSGCDAARLYGAYNGYFRDYFPKPTGQPFIFQQQLCDIVAPAECNIHVDVPHSVINSRRIRQTDSRA